MSEIKLLQELRDQIEQEFAENLVPYWTEFALDDQNGGFIGQVTYDNQKNYLAQKGGILNARLLWAFSAGCRYTNSPRFENAAKIAYQYFRENFVDKDFGGFYWILDAHGNVVEDRKHIYAQAFGIYGLAEYYAFTKDREALKMAYDVFHLIENKARDKDNGGYFESYSRKWELNGDARLSDKDENEPKSMNTHLHILEAYTNLYRYAPNSHLKNRLEELIIIFCEKIITPDQSSLVNFMDKDWAPKSDIISYGHNIEASWLLTEAAEVLGNMALLNSVRILALNLTNAVLANGVDIDGALLNEADSNKFTDTNKDWWPQVEAIIGFINAYEITKDEKYITAASNTWSFIKSTLIDEEYGEWYEKVSRSGTPYSKMDKVRSWKGPYHNMRMVFEVIRRVNKIEKESLMELRVS